MKVARKKIQDAIDLVEADIRGDLPEGYYIEGTGLETFPGRHDVNSGTPFNIVQGKGEHLESFAFHLAIAISEDAYSPGGEGLPTVVDVREIMEMRREILNMASVYPNDDGSSTFDMWIDEL